MQILFTAHGLRWHKPAYAASDASQQDWQDGRIPCNWARKAVTNPSRGSDADGGQPTTKPTNRKMRQGERARTHIHTHTPVTHSPVPVALPRRAGRIDDLVGPAMSRRWTPGVSISDVSDPPSRSPKHISTPSAAALRPSLLIRDIPHGRMVYGSSRVVHPPLPPSLLFRSSHTHTQNTHTPSPSQSQQTVKNYTHTYYLQPHGLPLSELPPRRRCIAACCMQETCKTRQPETWLAPQRHSELPRCLARCRPLFY